MKHFSKISILLLISLLLISCSKSGPSFSHVIVKSDRLGILIDTKDSKTLKTLSDIFNDKEESPDAGPDYKYLIDITIADKTVRWQYSDDGYIRNFEITASPIYYMDEYAEFNRTAKIK